MTITETPVAPSGDRALDRVEAAQRAVCEALDRGDAGAADAVRRAARELAQAVDALNVGLRKGASAPSPWAQANWLAGLRATGRLAMAERAGTA